MSHSQTASLPSHRTDKSQKDGAEGATDATNGTPTNVPAQVDPIIDNTNKKTKNKKAKETKTEDATTTAAAAEGEKAAKPAREPREPRERKQRGPPEDGVASKTKVMVANLPYDLGEEKVGDILAFGQAIHVLT